MIHKEHIFTPLLDRPAKFCDRSNCFAEQGENGPCTPEIDNEEESIECPYCGHQQTEELFLIVDFNDGGTTEHRCGSCGKDYEIETACSYVFTSRVTEKGLAEHLEEQK